MTTIDLVQKALKNRDPIPDSTAQSHFDKIATLIEKEKMTEAASMIEQIVAKGTLDIRLLAYYFYAHFFNRGVKCFVEMFPMMISLINEHWDNLRPLTRKEKHVQNSVNWLILELISKLRYCEKRAKAGDMHPIWVHSTVEITPDELTQVSAALAQFKDFFEEKWPQSPAHERLMHLLQIVEDLKQIVQHERDKLDEEATIDPPVEEVERLQSEEAQEEDQPEEQEMMEEIDEPQEVEELEQEEVLEKPESQEQLPEPVACPDDKASVPDACENMQIIVEKLRVFELLIKENEVCQGGSSGQRHRRSDREFRSPDLFSKIVCQLFFFGCQAYRCFIRTQ